MSLLFNRVHLRNCLIFFTLLLALSVVIVGFYQSTSRPPQIDAQSIGSSLAVDNAQPAADKIVTSPQSTPVTSEEKSIVDGRRGLEQIRDSHKTVLAQFDREEQLLFIKDHEAERMIEELDAKINAQGLTQ
ncbi:hypothetical protein ACVBE9_02635 [Eionea flava]